MSDSAVCRPAARPEDLGRLLVERATARQAHERPLADRPAFTA